MQLGRLLSVAFVGLGFDALAMIVGQTAIGERELVVTRKRLK